MSSVELRSAGDQDYHPVAWRTFSQAYECPVLLCPEVEGGYSIHALTLPGAVSEGETEEQAVANIVEAILLLIEGYLEAGASIPWEPVEVDDQPKNAKKLWVLVNV